MTDIRVAAEQARVALQLLIATNSEPANITMSIVADKEEFAREMQRCEDEVEAAVTAGRAALASLEAALAALPGDKGQLDALTDALLAFEAEGRYLSHPAVAYHGTANGDDPKEWERRYAKAKCDLILRHPAATPAVEAPQIAGRDGASDAPSDEGEREAFEAAMHKARWRDFSRVWAGCAAAATEGPSYQQEWLQQRWLGWQARAAWQVAHSSQAQGQLSVGPVVTNNVRMNEENQNG